VVGERWWGTALNLYRLACDAPRERGCAELACSQDYSRHEIRDNGPVASDFFLLSVERPKTLDKIDEEGWGVEEAFAISIRLGLCEITHHLDLRNDEVIMSREHHFFKRHLGCQSSLAQVLEIFLVDRICSP
jgi:hypothetical protein